MEFMDLLREFGPLAGVVVFFIWKDWKREDRQSTRIETLEVEQRKIILPLVTQSAEVIAKATEVISQNTLMMQRLEVALTKNHADEQQP